MPLLYKYLPPQRATFFDDGLLRMTQPGDLNDPLECLSFYPDFDPVALAISDLDGWRSDLERRTGLVYHPISYLLERQRRIEWASLPETKKRMFQDCYKSFTGFLDSLLGIISFSLKETSASMWEHYADNHRGFCLCLEHDHYPLPESSDDIQEGVFYDVKYGNTRLPIEMTAILNVKRNVIFMKSEAFRNEEETRVYYPLERADDISGNKSARNFEVFLKRFPHTSVRELLVGKDFGGELLTTARAFAEANRIPAYRMQPSTTGDLAMERGERIA